MEVPPSAPPLLLTEEDYPGALAGKTRCFYSLTGGAVRELVLP